MSQLQSARFGCKVLLLTFTASPLIGEETLHVETLSVPTNDG